MMYPVGVGRNTKILTDYAQKLISPDTDLRVIQAPIHTHTRSRPGVATPA